MKTALLVLVLLVSGRAFAQEEYPAPDVHNKFTEKDIAHAKEIMQNVVEKLPLWDEDWPGQFERQEIQYVRDDLTMCSTSSDVAEFMEDFELLMNDFDALAALDDELRIEHVI